MRASIRTRLLISLLIIAVASAGVLSWYFVRELEAYGLRKLEERLGSEAQLVGALAEQVGLQRTDSLNRALETAALDVNSRLIIVDVDGTAIADSAQVKQLGTGYAARPEIAAALAGEHGAYTRISPAGRLALYAAVPVREGGGVVGAAYASAETFTISTLTRDYRTRLIGLTVLFAAMTLLVAELLARWLSRPLRTLESGAVAFAAGDHAVRVTPSGSRETYAVGEAFNKMADEVTEMVSELRDEELRKSRFVSDVSHELRSPLTAIRGTAETLLEGDVGRDDQQRFLSTIVREADRLARLADDLLTLQRIEGATGELPIRRVDLGDVSRAAINALEHLTEMRSVSVELTGEAPAVLGDADRLQQVVSNLLDNASRHMSEGGVVRIELGREGDWATVAILDQGPGIPEEDVGNIFGRFYRSQPSRDRSTGGAGLGLSIVKAIVDRHAGTIEASNRPEGGMRFTVRLPALRG